MHAFYAVVRSFFFSKGKKYNFLPLFYFDFGLFSSVGSLFDLFIVDSFVFFIAIRCSCAILFFIMKKGVDMNPKK